MAVLHELEDAGIKVEARQFNTLLHVLAEAEGGEEAGVSAVVRVFVRMWMEEGVAPDRQSYNAIMNASTRCICCVYTQREHSLSREHILYECQYQVHITHSYI